LVKVKATKGSSLSNTKYPINCDKDEKR